MADRDEATALARVALAAISEPVNVSGQHIRATASIGVDECPSGQADPAEMMRAAGISLGWAKREGHGHCAVFDTDRDESMRSRSALAEALPAAIDRDEMVLEYQPIVSLSDGVMAAAEALVRWNHPTLGTLGPDQFIDIAEETGVIARLTQVVLAQACREAAVWREITASPPFVSVNVSPRQLFDSDLVRDVASVLERTGLPASQLCLEITEGAIVRPDGLSVSTLTSLVELGVTIAIDDFGTGYSNLSYLRRLPVCLLKIDRFFVAVLFPADRVAEAADVEILAAIVSLAHLLHLTVTAEGVETCAQAELLQSIGCDTGQGWYFGRPAGPVEIREVIRASGD